MRIAYMIVARMKSTRLPLKVLRLLNGRPMLEHLVERVKQTEGIDEFILCTSTHPQDEILVDYAKKLSIKCFRGSEEDVLKRMLGAAKKFEIDFIISTTADNPLTDPVYSTKIIKKFKNTNADFITALDLPIGCFSYGIKANAIEKALGFIKDEVIEIWGHYFLNNDEFIKAKIEIEKKYIKPFRLTVDTPEDFKVMKKVYKHLEKQSEIFTIDEIVELLDKHPEIVSINRKIVQHFDSKEQDVLKKEINEGNEY